MKERKNKRDLSNLDNQEFGKWTVLHKVEPKDKLRLNTYYLCRCVCGREKEVKAVNLVNRATTSCGFDPCKNKKDPKNKYGNDIVNGTVWTRLRRRAKMSNLELSITIEYLTDLFKYQNGKCALTGLDIWTGNCKVNGTASVDRKDSGLGYVEGNIQWVHKDINIMKRELPMDKFIAYCKLIAENFS